MSRNGVIDMAHDLDGYILATRERAGEAWEFQAFHRRGNVAFHADMRADLIRIHGRDNVTDIQTHDGGRTWL